MSSNEDDDESQSKKRRIQRACDICRRKKIRCDGAQMARNRCSNCIAYNFSCTYVEAAKKRGPPKGYIESLENRIEKMDQLLQRLMPDADFTKELGSRFSKDSWTPEQPITHIPDLMRKFSNQNPSCGPMGASRNHENFNSTEEQLLEDELQHLTLVDNLDMAKPGDGHGYRFFGKSSGAQLVKTALNMKKKYVGADEEEEFCSVVTLPIPSREEYWLHPPWENSRAVEAAMQFIFPDQDLMTQLIELYFTHLNIYMPLLHRPTFERELAERKHLKDDLFAAVLLLVCACASRYSDDDRVLLPGEKSRTSSGWQWFDQVQIVRRSLLSPPTLYDLQVYALLTEFLWGSSSPQAAWTMVGVGLRLAQDVGAHRRKKNDLTNTVESELWKRAFWILFALDRQSSSTLGRPCAIMDEDIDLDFPSECDDEYWEHPEPFKQPVGKPSVVTYFITTLKLNQILSFCLRTIYSLNKSKILLGFAGQQWEQHIVAELDSALNKWVDTIPDHLRWDPTRENVLFFDQSAHLYISYYHLQILIHRPFIPTPKNPSPLSFPSLAICTNAARSCSHVVDIQMKRSYIIPACGMPVFTAGIVLLFNIWGGQKSGVSIDQNKEMRDVHKCMNMLRMMESRWHIAGRLWDILYELASVGDLPLPNCSPRPNNKRERDSDSPLSHEVPTQSPKMKVDLQSNLENRAIAGTKRVASVKLSHPPPVGPPPMAVPEPSMSFALPMYSNELGSLPLHGQVDFSLMESQMGWLAPSSGAPLEPDFSFMNPTPTQSPTSRSTFYHMPPLDPPHSMMNSAFSYEYSPAGAGADSQLMDGTLAMWSSVPSGFELEDWGSYLTSVSEMNNGSTGLSVMAPLR